MLIYNQRELGVQGGSIGRLYWTFQGGMVPGTMAGLSIAAHALLARVESGVELIHDSNISGFTMRANKDSEYERAPITCGYPKSTDFSDIGHLGWGL